MNEDIGEKTVEFAIREGAEFADMRLFRGRETRISVESGEVKAGGAVICDAHFRIFKSGSWGVCSGNDPDIFPTAVRETVTMAGVHRNDPYSLMEYPFSRDRVRVNARIRPEDVDITEKVEYLKILEEHMKTNPIRKTFLFYKEVSGTKSIYNSKGAAIEEEVMYTCLNVMATARKGHRMETAFVRKYSSGGYELLERTEDLPLLAVQRASDLLTAREITPGKYNVILDPQVTGTFIHEVLGHTAEADLILQGNSVLKDKLGSTIARESMSVWDDPTIPHAPVCYRYDDEGVTAEKKPVILNGVLTSYFHSLDSASQMPGSHPGNGRCENYSLSPLIRMSNTFVTDSGSPDSDITEGLVLKGTRGGEVEPGSGQFVIKAEIGELIENCSVKKRFKNVAVLSSILEVLQTIRGVSDNFYLDSGTCEKEGQTVVIGSGGPSVSVSDVMVVGG